MFYSHVINCILGLSGGMLVAMPISGFLSVYGFSGGWPSVFYFFGEFLLSDFQYKGFHTYEYINEVSTFLEASTLPAEGISIPILPYNQTFLFYIKEREGKCEQVLSHQGQGPQCSDEAATTSGNP